MKFISWNVNGLRACIGSLTATRLRKCEKALRRLYFFVNRYILLL